MLSITYRVSKNFSDLNKELFDNLLSDWSLYFISEENGTNNYPSRYANCFSLKVQLHDSYSCFEVM